MEDNLNPEELVRVVALEVEAVVVVQVFLHHIHYSVYNDLDDVALLDQLPSLKNKRKMLNTFNLKWTLLVSSLKNECSFVYLQHTVKNRRSLLLASVS